MQTFAPRLGVEGAVIGEDGPISPFGCDRASPSMGGVDLLEVSADLPTAAGIESFAIDVSAWRAVSKVLTRPARISRAMAIAPIRRSGGHQAMRTWTGGRRAAIAALNLAILAGTFAVAATAVPIDFTGHWTGAATGKSQSPITLAADMTSSGRTVTGTMTATQDGQADTCTLNGRQTGRVKFRAKLTPCNVVLQGKFDAATDSITGHYVGHGHHKRETGTFSLTRAASPSGAFIDEAAGH